MFGSFVSTILLLFAVIGSLIGISASRKTNELSRTLRSQRNRLNKLQDQLNALSRETDESSKPVHADQREDKELAVDAVQELTTVSAEPTDSVEVPGIDEFVELAQPEKKLEVRIPPPIPKVGIPEPDSTPAFSDRPKKPSLQETLIAKLNIPVDKPLEEIIYSYVLPRLGVLGIAIAVFIVLALVAGDSPIGKVAIGYSVAAALFGLGKWSESKQPRYAQVAYGGGLAVAYLVTFATYFLPFAKIFESPYPCLGGLAFFVGIWAWMAERKKSPVLGMVVTVLGHFTIMLSAFSIEGSLSISIFSVLILSAGSAWFLLRNRWYYVASVGLVFSYLNHFLIMTRSESSDTVLEFSLALGVLTAYFLIYSLAEQFSHEDIRRKRVPVWFRTSFVSVNTGFYLVLGSLIMEGYTFAEAHHHIFRYGLAALLFGLGMGYWKRRNHDPLFNAYFTKASGALTLGLAYQFSGSALATSLAVEMLVLLFASRQSTLVVTRLLSYIVGTLALMIGLNSALDNTALAYGTTAFTQTSIQFALVTAAFWIASVIYQRTPWDAISPSFEKASVQIRKSLWQMDLASRGEDWERTLQKPLDGLLYPLMFALAGFILVNVQIYCLLPTEHVVMGIGVLSLAMMGIGYASSSLPLVVLSLGFLVTGFVASLYNLEAGSFTWHGVVGTACLVPVALASEKKWFESRLVFNIHTQPWTPYAAYPIVAIMCIALGLDWADTNQTQFNVLLIAAALLGCLSFVLHPLALCISGSLAYVFAWGWWNIEYPWLGQNESLSDNQSYLPYVGIGLVALGIIGDRLTRKQNGQWLGSALLCAVMVVAFRFVEIQLPEASRDWAVVLRSAVAVAFLAYGWYFKTKTAAFLSLLGLVLNSYILMLQSYSAPPRMELAPLIAGFLSAIAVWILYERLVSTDHDKLADTAKPQITGFLVAIVTLMSLMMLERIPVIAEGYLTVSWAILAVVLFFGAVVTRTSPYRYAGLAVLALSIGRVVLVDTTGLEAIPKALAYGGLGVVCLGLGWLYIRIFGFKQSDAADEAPTEEEISAENEIE